jgi:plastocyanin
MNKNLIIGLVTVVLLTGVYWYTTNNHHDHDDHEKEVSQVTKKSDTTKNPAPVIPSGVVHQVSYTDDGFANKLTIKANDQVVFTNNSSEALLVTFGEHGNHAEYPDGKDHPMIAKGMTDTITFPKAGTYEFHNHYLDEHTGEIVVE